MEIYLLKKGRYYLKKNMKDLTDNFDEAKKYMRKANAYRATLKVKGFLVEEVEVDI